MKHVSIVIVNWNGRKATLNCLNSIKKIEKKDCQLSVVVVDNGSEDDSVKTISTIHPWVKTLSLRSNTGFVGGNNYGIQIALKEGADFVWLLNNDTTVDSRALLSMLSIFSNPQAGIVGSKIYFAPGHEFHKDRYKSDELGKVIWYAGGMIDWKNMYAFHRGVDEVDIGQFDKVEKTDFVTGCSMMIKKHVFEKVGMFDQRFYLYLEDLDLCLRAKHVGFSVFYAPAAKIWHFNAVSSGGAGSKLHRYYLTRNRLLIGYLYAPFRTKLALLRQAIKMLMDNTTPERMAVKDALCGRFGKQYEPEKYYN